MNKKILLPFLSLLVIFLSITLSNAFRSYLPPSLPSLPPNPSPLPTSHFPASTSPRLQPRRGGPTSSRSTSLIAVGDIMLGRYCNIQMLKRKDWHYPFLKTADLTRSADIAFGNLETPIIQNCLATETGMIFCARPEATEGLKFAGFDVLSIANNHILNYGQNGLEQTKKLLSSSNILYSPLTSSMPSSNSTSLNGEDSKITIYQSNNLTFGFFSFDLVTYPQTPLISQISLTSPTVDILIVSLHWGTEYAKQSSLWQVDLAHQIIDSGAKIIIGHHPHVTQPVETYHNGLIFYSLGNFVFDQPWSEETKKGAVAKIIFEEKNIKSYELIPIYIQNYCQPRLN